VRRRSLPEEDRRDFERRGKAGSALTRASRSSRRCAPRHRFSRGATTQQGRPRRRGEPLQEEAAASRLRVHGESSGTGDGGLVLRNRRTGDGEGWEKNGETRFGGQAACADFGRPRRQADASVDDERAAQDGFGVRAVIAENDGKHGRGPRRRCASLSPPRSMKRFRGARGQDKRVVATVLSCGDAIYRNRRGAAAGRAQRVDPCPGICTSQRWRAGSVERAFAGFGAA
jgi:hypothetical protein